MADQRNEINQGIAKLWIIETINNEGRWRPACWEHYASKAEAVQQLRQIKPQFSTSFKYRVAKFVRADSALIVG